MPLHSQDKGAKAGAVIFVTTNGKIKVQNVKSGKFLDEGDIAVGKSIYEGHILETGENGKAMLLFSNGSMTTLASKSKLNIQEFKQTPFKANAQTIGTLKEEPSSSKTKLKLDYGELVFNVKKLHDDSTYVLNSPVGTAGIRGTAGQLAITVNEAGVASGGVSMVDGAVNFTAPSGNSTNVPAGQGTVVQVGPTGEQIGATQTVAVAAEVAQSITESASEASDAAEDITVENLSNAAEETGAQAEEAAQPAPPEGEGADDADPEGEAKSEQAEALDTVQAAAAGASGGPVFVAAGTGQEVEDVANLARDLTNALAIAVAQDAEANGLPVEVFVAITIQGAIEGAVASATIAGLDADAIASIRAAASSVSLPVQNLLGAISLTDVLANVDPSILIAEVTDPALTDEDVAAMSSNAFADALEPFISDRDGDGLFDATEESIGTDPDNPDSDGDLLMDGFEYHIANSNPQVPDTDGDGVSDSIEVGIGEEPSIANAYGPDSDGDGIPDSAESTLGTVAKKGVGAQDGRDTDGDGFHDGFEVGVGWDPTVPVTTFQSTGFTVSPIGPGDPFPWLYLGNPPE